MAEARKTRKTRIVCLSDTHNAIPGGAFKLPKGDVLIHAGDLTNQGSYSELQKAVKWIEAADFEYKIVVAGNHDITLDPTFYDQYGLYFHNQAPENTARCQKLLAESPSILYLKHESATVKLTVAAGPQTTFKVFGSPFSPSNGMWAHGYGPEEAVKLWEKIPLDTDIVVTHSPPRYHCDERDDRRAAGCEALRCALWRIRPRLAICGHVHESRGSEIIKWDLSASNIKYKEIGIKRWVDPGKDNKKTSIVDLTEKGESPIDNDGSVASNDCHEDQKQETASTPDQDSRPAVRRSVIDFTQSETFDNLSIVAQDSQPTIRKGLSRMTTSLLAIPSESIPPATRGQGGFPPSHRCDLEALFGRMGRRETCVVNAAIMASSWPHKKRGGKIFNKPIVVDIDLPVRKSETDR